MSPIGFLFAVAVLLNAVGIIAIALGFRQSLRVQEGLLLMFAMVLKRKRAVIHGELTMSKELFVGKNVNATVAYKNAEGAAATVVGNPTWSVAPDGIVNLTPGPDGLTCNVVPIAPGDATITVTAEGDETAGVDTITLTADVTVHAEEATTGEITFA